MKRWLLGVLLGGSLACGTGYSLRPVGTTSRVTTRAISSLPTALAKAQPQKTVPPIGRGTDRPGRGDHRLASAAPSLMPPFCGEAFLLDSSAGHPLWALSSQSLLFTCGEITDLALFTSGNTDSTAFNRRQQFGARYGEFRDNFVALRKQVRALPRAAALDRAEKLLPVALSRAILPLWLGTAWRFGGVSDIPGKGAIDCGNFVVSSLYTLGLNVLSYPTTDGRRYYTLATHAAEFAIRKLVQPSSITRFSNRPVAEVETKVRAVGPGAYLIGLDNHVGFVVYDGHGPVWFWHAKPGHQVRLEKPAAAPYFANSRYRVLARLDRRTAAIWLDNQLVHIAAKP